MIAEDVAIGRGALVSATVVLETKGTEGSGRVVGENRGTGGSNLFSSAFWATEEGVAISNTEDPKGRGTGTIGFDVFFL